MKESSLQLVFNFLVVIFSAITLWALLYQIFFQPIDISKANIFAADDYNLNNVVCQILNPDSGNASSSLSLVPYDVSLYEETYNYTLTLPTANQSIIQEDISTMQASNQITNLVFGGGDINPDSANIQMTKDAIKIAKNIEEYEPKLVATVNPKCQNLIK